MAGISLSMDVQDRFGPEVRAALATLHDFTPSLKKIGVRMVGSLKRNIAEGGRPTKWKGTHGKPYTLRFNKKGKEQHGKIGRDKGTMMNSVQVQDLTATYVAVGPGTETGKWFHGGTRPHIIRAKRKRHLSFWYKKDGVVGHAKKEVVQHPGTIPRPFVMFQDSDELYVDDVVLELVDKAFN